VKLIDFGSSVQLESNASAKTMLGTLGYVAPEVLKGKSYTAAVGTSPDCAECCGCIPLLISACLTAALRSPDMWAVGVIAFVLLCGCFPFNQQNVRTVHRSHYKLEWPKWAKNISHDAREFVATLLEYRPSKRLTASQALAHPWIVARSVPNLPLESPGRLQTLALKQEARRRDQQETIRQRQQRHGHGEDVAGVSPLRVSRTPRSRLGRSAPAM